MTRPEPQRGFTLLEVLVALAVIAIAMGGVMRAVSSNISNTGYLQEKTLAHWIAMNKMNEYMALEKFPTAGSRDKGSVVYAGHEWAWSAETKKESIMDYELGVVTVEVRFNEGDESPRASLVSAFPTSK